MSALSSGKIDQPSPDVGKQSLGQAAASGVAWLSLVSLISKFVSFFGQIVIGWLLGAGDFGAVGLAFTLASFAGILQQAGLRDILTQRQARWRYWATPGLWMSLAMGLSGALVMIGIAPFAAVRFHTPSLVPLLALLALRGIFDSILMIPQVQLQIQMRFKAQAVANVIASTSTIVFTLAFAWRGLGVYSLILPLPIVSLGQVIALWWLTKPPVGMRPYFQRWRSLSGDSLLLLATALFGVAVSNGDYLSLGLFHRKEVVGIYFFAFNLSTQTTQVLVGGLSGVLFAAMTKLQFDPDRQIAGTLRAGKMLGLLAVPLCALQSTLAAPLFHLLWHDRWLDAVVPFRWLTLAGMWGVIAAPFGGLLKAQGRFLRFFLLSMGLSLGFIAMVGTAAWLGGAVTVAVAVLIHTTLSILIIIRIVLGSRRDLFFDIWQLLVLPCIATGLALVPPFVLCYLIPRARLHDLVLLAGFSTVFCIFYFPMARWLMPEASNELVHRIGGLRRIRIK